MKVTPTLLTAYKLLAIMQVEGISQTTTVETMTQTGYNKQTTNQSTFKLKQNAVVVENGVLASLSSRALKITVKLMDELCWQNALWYYEAADSRDRTALKEMRDKNILVRTEDPHIHLVNPILIRKGSPGGVITSMLRLLETVSRVDRSLIKDLRYTGGFKFNPFYQIQA